jgi:hypothetical protein
MPSDPQQPRRRSWQSSGSPSSGARAKHGWQGAQDKAAMATGKGRLSARTKLVLVGLGFFILAAVFAFLLPYLVPSKPPQLVLVPASNSENLKAPFAVQCNLEDDSKRLLADLNITLTSAGLVAGKPETWDSWVAECQAKGLEKAAEKVVLILAAPGAVDAEGPYLVLDQEDPRAGNRFRIQTLLDQLGSLPRTTKKLVVLDPTQTTAYWPLGMMHNEFIKKLQGMESEI